MRCIGIDLAWGERARTGVARLADDGRLAGSASVRTDDEIAAFLGAEATGPGVVAAIDAPLVVPNDTGQRPCEREMGRLFGRFHAAAYPANRGNPAFAVQPRGARLAHRFAWRLDPAVVPGRDDSVALEVYPHPAMVSLFGLDRVIPYKGKRGRDVSARQSAFEVLLNHMEVAWGPLLRLDDSARWTHLRDRVRDRPRQVDLDVVEDEVDAIVCAALAWMWLHDRDRLMVLGDAASGYIVTPPPPTGTGGQPRG